MQTDDELDDGHHQVIVVGKIEHHQHLQRLRPRFPQPVHVIRLRPCPVKRYPSPSTTNMLALGKTGPAPTEHRKRLPGAILAQPHQAPSSRCGAHVRAGPCLSKRQQPLRTLPRSPAPGANAWCHTSTSRAPWSAAPCSVACERPPAAVGGLHRRGRPAWHSDRLSHAANLAQASASRAASGRSPFTLVRVGRSSARLHTPVQPRLSAPWPCTPGSRGRARCRGWRWRRFL